MGNNKTLGKGKSLVVDVMENMYKKSLTLTSSKCNFNMYKKQSTMDQYGKSKREYRGTP